MAQETTAKYQCGAKKTIVQGDRLEINLVCRIDMTEWPEHTTHVVNTEVDNVWIKYQWLS